MHFVARLLTLKTYFTVLRKSLDYIDTIVYLCGMKKALKSDKMKVAIFARVSTKDKQDYTRQVNELTTFCDSQNWEIVEVITEKISGAKKSKDRPAITQLMKLAKTGKIQKVVSSEVSRFGRNTAESLRDIETLKEMKVSFYVMNYRIETLKEDGAENPMGQFLITLLLDIGRMERLTTIERIHSGLAEARRKGKKLGRPEGVTKTDKALLKQYSNVVRELEAGLSLRKVAKLCDVALNTVQKVKAVMQSAA